MPEKKPFERLPKHAVPVLYDLFLKPNLKAYTFEGKTKIKLNVSMGSPTSKHVPTLLGNTLGN